MPLPLCTDGLSAVVDRGALHAAVSVPAEPELVAGQLIDLAYATAHPTPSLASSPTPSRDSQAATAAHELSRIAVESSDSDSIRRRVSDSRVHHR